MTTRKILFIGQTGELGGAEFVLFDIARHYRATCHVLLLADGPFRHKLAAAGISVSVLPAGRAMLGVARDGGAGTAARALPATVATAWRVARVARDYDLLYPNSQKAAVVAMLAGQLAGKPVVWHLHDILSVDHFAGLQRRLVVLLANHAARRVVTNSAASRDAFIACGGDPQRIAVVANGIDPAPFDPLPAADALTYRPGSKAGSKAGGKLVGLFGRIAPWKGQHVLIEALAALDDVHALIVGDALFGEDAYKASLLARADALGVADRVHWLGFRSDVPALMGAVDVVIHASTAPEPFGRVIVESMLARRPVIATAGGATAELLGDDYEFLVPPGDPAALADAVARALAVAPELAAQRAEAGFQRATQLFSVATMVSGIDRELALAA